MNFALWLTVRRTHVQAQRLGLEEKPGDADRSNFKLHSTVDFWTNCEADVPGAGSHGAFNMCVNALSCKSHIIHSDSTKLGIQILILCTSIACMSGNTRTVALLQHCVRAHI